MQVLPGDLCFVLPDKSLSRKMSIELSTLMVTSKLITAFSKPLPFVNKLKQQAMMQALRTRKGIVPWSEMSKVPQILKLGF